MGKRGPKSQWIERLGFIQEALNNCVSLQYLADYYGVSKQRMAQVVETHQLKTQWSYYRTTDVDKPIKYFWFKRMLSTKGIKGKERKSILSSFEIPDFCPCLGIELNYLGSGVNCERGDDSPSIDRINSSIGYQADNIQIISWRANRIKNDSTPDELMKIAKYMQRFKNNS